MRKRRSRNLVRSVSASPFFLRREPYDKASVMARASWSGQEVDLKPQVTPFGAGGAFGLAVDAAHALGGFPRVHALGKGTYALGVAVAAAGKAHIMKASFGVDVKFYVARAYACWCVVEVHINIM